MSRYIERAALEEIKTVAEEIRGMFGDNEDVTFTAQVNVRIGHALDTIINLAEQAPRSSDDD